MNREVGFRGCVGVPAASQSKLERLAFCKVAVFLRGTSSDADHGSRTAVQLHVTECQASIPVSDVGTWASHEAGLMTEYSRICCMSSP
jgi:hypothetical protein